MPSIGTLLRMLVAVLAGVVLYVASPPRDLWWLAPLAVGVLAWLVQGRRARAGFGYGTLFGLGYLLLLLIWLLDFLGAQFGPWPWLGVAGAEALFFGLAGAGMARVSRLPGAPVWMAAVFVAAELLKTWVPFGGFPWGRLAFTQPTGVLVPLASVGGAGLVTFAVALVGAALALAIRRWRERPRCLVAPAVLAVAPLVAGAALMPTLSAAPNAGTARASIVQGNAPNVGLGLLYADDVLHANHIRGANRLAEEIRSGKVARSDFVLLPEQVGNVGPSRYDPDLARVTARLGVPVLVGGLVEDRDSRLYNRIMRWDPRRGDDAEYTKQHLVPFAETIPMRPLARMVTPFVDRFQQDMTPGDEPGVFTAGPARVGVGVCFDVAYDDVFTGATRAGATVLAVPTNNAWYGHSEMSHQQLAMARLRAVEHSRAVLVSATSGVSAVVQPDGTVTRQTRQFTAENVTASVPLRSTETLATRLGALPTWILAALGAAAVVASWWPRPARAR